MRPFLLPILSPIALLAMETQILAQDPAPETIRGQPPEQIDILVRQSVANGEEALGANCGEDPDAGVVSGEIVVCARRGEASDGVWDQEAWENRYAAETRGADPVDVAGAGIFRGPATIGGLCIPGLQKCPPPPAIVIDFAALPQAPPGSDADRIGRGLPPLGRDTAAPVPQTPPGLDADRAEALDLPPLPDFAPAPEATQAAPVNRAGSEAPAAPR